MIILRHAYNFNLFIEEQFDCESFKVSGFCCLSGACCKGC